jgi:hypothetical protein
MGARARVRLVLDIDCTGGNWGNDCTVGQIRKQAAEETLERINRYLKNMSRSVTVIGEPKVTVVMLDED